MHDRHMSRRRWGRLLGALLASAVVAIGLALVPSGFAQGNSGSEPHPGADKQQSSSHGDCKNHGSKSDTHSTTGNHNGYDCAGTSNPQGGGTDNDGDTDNPSDNDSDDQGTTSNPTDNDGDHDQNGPSDNDADDHPSSPTGGTNGANGTNGTSGTSGTSGTAGPSGAVINVAGLQQVAGANARRAPVACASRRHFTIHIRQIDHYRYTSATVFLGNKRIKTIRGARRIHSGIVLTGLPKGTFHVKITVRTSSGKTLRNVRTYHTCVPRRKHTVPKL